MRVFRRLRHAVATCPAIVLVCCLSLGVALAVIADAVWPELGDNRWTKDGMTIDASHASDGYIQVCYEKDTNKRLKLRISQGNTLYTYDLNGKGRFELFPLQMGSGTYTCTLYENVSGSKYAKAAETSVSVQMNDENAAFLCPSQYVNYSKNSPAVTASEEICEGLETDQEKLDAIRSYMIDSFDYDFVRAANPPGSYLGDIDGCFETRIGLCQDLAAVTACMLRVQGVPTQLVIGYVNNMYHAWNNVYIDGKFQRLDITALLSGYTSDMVYTAERYY